MNTPLVSSILLALFLISSCYSVTAQPFDYPTAKLSTTWTNKKSAPHSIPFTDGSTVRAILLRSGSFGSRFACGFYCNGTCDSYLFAVFIVQTNSGSGIVGPAIAFPQVVWSANRNHPVKLGAKLNLNKAGDLVLRDADGSLVWSTNTAGKQVTGMQITETGNLVLVDARKRIVWQSFDHPTDSLVPGQKLFEGQKLVASVSSTNWRKGLYSVEVTNKGLFGYLETKQRRVYYKYVVNGPDRSKERSYVRFLNGSLALFIHSAEPSRPDGVIRVSLASSDSAQYMKLMPDGHLKVLEWSWQTGWRVVADLFGVRRRSM
ncbi:putative bulb-type lectin domain-containing protein [Helianthus annuus]|uniref:Bulb-type lectin domain-containing protein n=1 Tax=Helianthus annuus TaxID=4232 RepID=A0A251SN49_HELAN|nr:G-type lectin S-receptor-like serine/threonine-protein kinase At5g35370 [Helianthus annuus]KAF5771580.1 putative bulb-type lectin domain-containing protein [Helianthus annuus]KAJ0479196.1 putative bulb-type lectin domain-containing protein [Helianthus annuus]KAJ0496146.1 putative bulb-type lectin domain-containing protein [Helianthus annuus]KAJ0847464.1 putative bulb-type lectin domain-containing protein [Helianthus annuus]KAJ0856421.1 putative bulb-type lectin domain-containing protein [He